MLTKLLAEYGESCTFRSGFSHRVLCKVKGEKNLSLSEGLAQFFPKLALASFVFSFLVWLSTLNFSLKFLPETALQSLASIAKFIPVQASAGAHQNTPDSLEAWHELYAETAPFTFTEP